MLHNPTQADLFPKLSNEELDRLSQHGSVLTLEDGAVIFREGDPTYHFYVVLEGQIKITKQVGVEEKVLVIHEAGEFTGELSMLTGSPAIATGQSLGNSRVLEITPDEFQRILAECSQGASVILAAMAGRAKDVEAQLRQQEKLAALGRLSAGLAHELNNPAAAGRRAASQLQSVLESVQRQTLHLCEQKLSVEQREWLTQLQTTIVQKNSTALGLDPLTQSDREDELSDWLDEQGVKDGWKLASVLVSFGLDASQLEPLATQVDAIAFNAALHWLEATLTVSSLVYQIEHSTARISELVQAMKSYSYMDQAAIQEVDIHQGLESTLTILHHKLKQGITVVRDYDPQLPRIFANGGELNQVWTNLIDNAIDAMQGHGTLTLKTERSYEEILIEIMDTGSGIPPDIQSRIFDPFFTTKGVGVGSGLGLDIARRIVQQHHGDIRVDSNPGNTRFQIHLPIAQSRPASNSLTTKAMETKAV